MIKLFCTFLVFVNLSCGDELSLTKQAAQAFSEGNYLEAGNLNREACDKGDRAGCANLNVLLSSEKLSNNDKQYYYVNKRFKEGSNKTKKLAPTVEMGKDSFSSTSTIRVPITNKNTKRYTSDAFIDKVSLLMPKDDFETKEEYLLRIRQEMGGDVVLVQYPSGSISWFKYDLEQKKFNTNFSIKMLFIFPNHLGFKNTSDLQKKMIPKGGYFADTADVSIPYGVEMAKTVKDLPNYGFEIYALVKIDEQILKEFSRYQRKSAEVNVENIIIQNNFLNYYQELL